MQAAIAFALAFVFPLPRWWRTIHLLFPLIIWAMRQFDIPTYYYLFGFLLTLSLFWTIFRTRVPFYPSRLPVWQELIQLLPHDRAIKMIDIGSGLGDLAMHVAKELPNSNVIGIEIAPLPWIVSKFRARFRKSSARFMLGDYFKLDFSEFDAVFAYLSPAAMPGLWEKASREMQPGSLLVSYEFDIPGIQPQQTIEVSGSSAVIYVWRFE